MLMRSVGLAGLMGGQHLPAAQGPPSRWSASRGAGEWIRDTFSVLCRLCSESGSMSWVLLVVAGLFETGFAILLKQSHHFTRL
jgi:hypothetical protein